MYNKLLRYSFVFILFSLRTASTVKKKSSSIELVSKPKSLGSKRCNCIDTENCSKCKALFSQYNEVEKIPNIVRDCYVMKLDKIDESKIAQNIDKRKKLKIIDGEQNKDKDPSISIYVKKPVEQENTHTYRDCFSEYGLHFSKYGTPLPIKEDKSYRLSSNVLKNYLAAKGNVVPVYPKNTRSKGLTDETVRILDFLEKSSSSKDCGLTNSSNSGSSKEILFKSKRLSSKKDINDDIKILSFDKKDNPKLTNHNNSKLKTEVYYAPEKNDLSLKNTAMVSEEVVDKTSLRRFNIGYLVVSIIMLMILIFLGYLAWPYVNEFISLYY